MPKAPEKGDKNHQPISHDGSMVLLYMVCHGSHQYTTFMLPYIAYMDPMGMRSNDFSLEGIAAFWPRPLFPCVSIPMILYLRTAYRCLAPRIIVV